MKQEETTERLNDGSHLISRPLEEVLPLSMMPYAEHVILDRALRDAVYRDEGCITREELTEAAEELGLSRSRAEFGYMGGRNHAVD